MKDKNKLRLKKLSIQVVAILVINVLVILLFLQLSSVQTYLGSMLTNSVSKTIGYKINIEKVDIEWLDKAILEQVTVKDLASNKMIRIEQIFINYRFSSLLSERANIIDQITLHKPIVQLSLSDSIPLNITSFITALKAAYAPKKKKKAKPFLIKEVSIESGTFTYNHKNRLELENRFDYNHFGLDSIELRATDLIVVADTFGLNVISLRAIETSTGLAINSLSAEYEVSNSRMMLNKLALSFGSSLVRDSVVFSYKTMADLKHFTDKVHILAYFNQMKLATQDLKYFAPYFKNIYDTLQLKGNLNGHLKDFNVKNFVLKFGKQSSLKGNAYFEGLPDVYNTFIDFRFKNSTVYKPDLAIYIPSTSFEIYYPIESANITGTFTGYPKDFVAKASFNTSLGYIHTDLNLKLDNNPAKSKYSGAITLNQFDLGKIFNAKSFIGKATLSGKVEGVGLTKKSANFNLESKIDEIFLNNYNYTNITTNAHFSQQLFDGLMEINDPNLQFHTTGIIDLRPGKNIVQMEGELQNAQLNALNIRTDTSSISAKFKVNVQGLSIDKVIGTIDIAELKATNNSRKYQVNNLELISEIKNNERVLVLYSDRVKVKLLGDFNLTTAYADLNYLWKRNKVKFRNHSNEITEFYKKYSYQPHVSNIDFEIELKNINPLLNLFDPLIYLDESTSISGKFTTGYNINLEANFKNDTIIYDHNKLINNKIEIISKGSTKENEVVGELKIDSESQILRSGSSLDSLAILTEWKNDSIYFDFHIRQKADQNVNKVIGSIYFKTDTTLLKFNKSQIQVLKQTWAINKNNLVVFTKNNLRLSNMSIKSKDQKISVSGSISKHNNNPIFINIEQVQMNNLNPLVTNKLEGVVNGSAEISNIFSAPLFETNFNINSFKVDGLYFGNIIGASNWNSNFRHFDVNLIVDRNQKKLLDISGSYNPLGDKNVLQLEAKLLNTDLKFAQPFTNLFTNIQGNVTGKINITGALFRPVLNGSGKINKASFTIDYLKSKLWAQGNWALDSSSISLSDVRIKDDTKGSGLLNATFYHSNFKSFTMDLDADFNYLKVLNTVSKDNDYFYGTAIGSGNISIAGPLANLVINTRAKTEKGTKFYIPLSNSKSNTKQEDFITFSNFTQKETKATVETEEKVNLKNVTVNLDIEITPDAYAEIIFDLTAGDIIRGRGKGNMSIGIDTKGKFTVLGDYEFTEGAYNFTMYNIVNKEFRINPKSKIFFSGDPYLGKLKINADYKVNTSLAPIIDTVYHNLPEAKRIYPAKVLLDLNGPLLSPDIAFDIIIEDYPRANVNIDTEVRAFLNKIKNDEQEMNRQVFSLLVFRKFSPPNSFSTGGTLGSSVSEFVSNQLSYWISQVDDNLTIDIDLNDLDADALKTFQLRLSYAFMDGKLIITRDGGFTDQNQEATLSSITGDWTVEYLLSKDEKLRIKFFKKTNYDQLSSSTGSNDELITGGFSLLYTTSFDRIKDLFNKNKNKKEKQSTNKPDSKEAIKPKEDENTP